VVTTWMGDCL